MSPPPAPQSSRHPRRKGRRRLFAALAVTLSFVGMIAAVEAFLRIADPIGQNHETEFTRYRNEALRYAWDGLSGAQLGSVDLEGMLYHHKPSLNIDFGSYRLRTNSLGYRGPEISKQKPEGTFRILVIGDSVAYGTGVNDEVTFLRRWEGELNAAGKQHYEVINTGHPMYDSTQELALLRDEGLALQPDLVLLVYVVNDIEPTRDVVESALLGKAPNAAETLPDPGDFWTRSADWCAPLLPSTAKLLRLQSDPAVRMLSTMPKGTEYVPELFGKGPRGWVRSRQALLQMKALCLQANVPFFLLDHSLPAVRALPGFCEENQIPYFLFRFTPDELARPIRNSLMDSHSNAAGHEVLLSKLRAIATQLPLPR